VVYSPDLELCMLNWASSTMAYSATIAFLVAVPTLCTIVFASVSIVLLLNRPDEVLSFF
jgi:hypothetical protein